MKKKPINYTVERHFLSKITTGELLARIIKAHISKKEGMLNG